MFKISGTDRVIASFHVVLVVIFLRSTSAVVVIAAFILLCGYVLQSPAPLPRTDFAKPRVPHQRQAWGIMMVNLLFYVFRAGLIGLLSWILLGRKAAVIQGILT
ncbi:MAG TPA: hypothetical protein VD996_17235 [Chitinophagaceae bacterium]|nr:hypothetical protein [Chitinophagaceae bacterium]